MKRSVQNSDGSNEDVEIPTTPAGVFWDDLPYFVADMTDFWVNDCAAMGATQRLNFSYFLAKCASTGLDHDRLFQIALLVFCDTFETARPLGSVNDTDTETFSIAALLTSTCAWLHEAGRKIILFSDISWHDCPDDIGRGSPTFLESELGQKSSSAGFSPGRFMYWLKRLDEIAQELAQAGKEKLAEDAEWTIDVMLVRLRRGRRRF